MNINAVHTISHLKDKFSIEGVSSELMSENEPPFNSNEFPASAQTWNFPHVKILIIMPRVMNKLRK